MPARSLLAMSTRVAAQNVRSLTDIGNIPYSLARPFLIRIESPKQLRELEKNSPHLMQDDRELWMDFIKRDIPQWDQYDLPKESDCWYDIYCDLLEQVQREVEEGALQLKQAVDKFYSDKASNAAVFVQDTSRLPKPKRRFQAIGTGRSEPKKNTIFSSKRNKVLAVPTHRLPTGASQIRNVPQWLVDEHKQVSSTPAVAASPRKRPDSVTTAPSTSASPSTSSTTADARPSRITSKKVIVPRSRTSGLTSLSETPTTNSQIPSSPRPVIPRKRPTEGSPPRAQPNRSEITGNVPVRAPLMSTAKTLVRKRPTASQPNVFIQQKKRRT